MSNADEPNLVVYSLIKEIDYLVESSNQLAIQSDHSDRDIKSNPSNLSSNTAFGVALPSGMIADYKVLLAISIEIFQNNFNP